MQNRVRDTNEIIKFLRKEEELEEEEEEGSNNRQNDPNARLVVGLNFSVNRVIVGAKKRRRRTMRHPRKEGDGAREREREE